MISPRTILMYTCVSFAVNFAFAESSTSVSSAETTVGTQESSTAQDHGTVTNTPNMGETSTVSNSDLDASSTTIAFNSTLNQLNNTTTESTSSDDMDSANQTSSMVSTESSSVTKAGTDGGTLESSTTQDNHTVPITSHTGLVTTISTEENSAVSSGVSDASASITTLDTTSTQIRLDNNTTESTTPDGTDSTTQISSIVPTEPSSAVTNAGTDVGAMTTSTPAISDKVEVNSTSAQASTSPSTSTTSSMPTDRVTVPPVTQTVSLQFEIVYDNDPLDHLGGRKRRWTSRRLLQDNELQDNLENLYRNGTNGFLSLGFVDPPNDECTTVKYKVFYDGEELTKACISSGCELQQQITDNVLNKIGRAGEFGNCTVNTNATEEQMKTTLTESEQILGNPCLMSPYLCRGVGKEYTCVYEDTKALYCLNVCINFCDGGECYADHEGKAACRCPAYTYLGTDNSCHDRCPTFNFLADDDRCYSWWIILGPLIGVAAIAILLIVVLVLCRRRPTRDEQKQKMLSTSGNEIENPVYVFSDHNVDESKGSDLKLEGPPTTTFKEELKSFGDEAGTTAPGADEPDVRVAEERDQTNTRDSGEPREDEPDANRDQTNTRDSGEPREDEPDANRDQTNARSNMNGAAPRGRRQDDLQDFATMTSQQLADHPDFRDFQPQLDKVDTTIQCIIKRPHINDQATKRHSSSRYEEDSNGRASYIRDERDRI